MARSQAANLSGLLSDIGGTLGKMGEPGQQYVDTFRRLQAPDVDMNDADSLLNYANYARRNGYDEEAKQYLALGAAQQKLQQKKSYENSIANDTQKLRGYNTSLSTLKNTIKQLEQSDVTSSDLGPMPNPKLDNARMALSRVEGERANLIQGMNDRGESNPYGVANAGNTASRALSAEEYAAMKEREEQLKREREREVALAEWGETIEQGSPATLQHFNDLGLSKRDWDTYMGEYKTKLDSVNTYAGANSPAGLGIMKQWQTAKMAALTSKGNRRTQQVEAQAPGVGARALTRLVTELDTEGGTNWFTRKFTDQADSLQWIQDPANLETVQKIMTSAAKTVMLNTAGAEEMSPSELDEAVQKEFISQLSTFSSEFKDQYEEDVIERSEDMAGANARTAIENMGDGYGKESGRKEFLESQAAKFANDLPNVDPSTVTSDWVRKNHNDLWQDWNDTFTSVWQERHPKGKTIGVALDGSGLSIGDLQVGEK